MDEVWLLDRQDGSYDWGLIVTSTDAADREGVAVTAQLLDAGGEVIVVVGDEIGVLPAGGRAAVGGVVTDPGGSPVRIGRIRRLTKKGRPPKRPPLGSVRPSGRVTAEVTRREM